MVQITNHDGKVATIRIHSDAHKLILRGTIEGSKVELRDLVPQPVRLESIDIYASGHGYRARITNVAIVGTEVPKSEP